VFVRSACGTPGNYLPLSDHLSVTDHYGINDSKRSLFSARILGPESPRSIIYGPWLSTFSPTLWHFACLSLSFRSTQSETVKRYAKGKLPPGPKGIPFLGPRILVTSRSAVDSAWKEFEVWNVHRDLHIRG